MFGFITDFIFFNTPFVAQQIFGIAIVFCAAAVLQGVGIKKRFFDAKKPKPVADGVELRSDEPKK